MSSVGQVVSPQAVSLRREEWFAIQTRPRHEKRVAQELAERHVTAFLPLTIEKHRWSDRVKLVEVPLFSCYAFVAIDPVVENRLAVLRTPGVLGFVGSNHHPKAIPDSEIDAVRAVLAAAAHFSEHPFLKIGQRVRVRGGALDGVEGILSARNGHNGLVVSIDAIQRSLLVEVRGYDVEAI